MGIIEIPTCHLLLFTKYRQTFEYLRSNVLALKLFAKACGHKKNMIKESKILFISNKPIRTGIYIYVHAVYLVICYCYFLSTFIHNDIFVDVCQYSHFSCWRVVTFDKHTHVSLHFVHLWQQPHKHLLKQFYTFSKKKIYVWMYFYTYLKCAGKISFYVFFSFHVFRYRYILFFLFFHYSVN